jgi:hypothetical protein
MLRLCPDSAQACSGSDQVRSPSAQVCLPSAQVKAAAAYELCLETKTEPAKGKINPESIGIYMLSQIAERLYY